MFDNFVYSINAIVPLFALIAFGMYARHVGILDAAATVTVNRLCFRYLIPCLLLSTTISSRLDEAVDVRLMAYTLVIYTVFLVALWWLVPKFVPARGRTGSVIHSCLRANVVLFGLPLARNLFGDEGMAPTVILTVLMNPVFVGSGVLVLSYFSERRSAAPSVGQVAREMLATPLIIASFVGIVVLLLGVKPPAVVMKPLADLGYCGNVLAIVALGSGFDWRQAAGNWRISVSAAAVRLVVMPLIAVTGAYLAGIRGGSMGAVFLVFGGPAAATCAMIAENMGCDSRLPVEIIILTTAASAFTMFAGIFILKTYGLI